MHIFNRMVSSHFTLKMMNPLSHAVSGKSVRGVFHVLCHAPPVIRCPRKENTGCFSNSIVESFAACCIRHCYCRCRQLGVCGCGLGAGKSVCVCVWGGGGMGVGGYFKPLCNQRNATS